MKDSEFIELLNLYLDHEIDAEDVGRLEAEVNSGPERLQIYRQYCRMHKACAGLADRFGDGAEPARGWAIAARAGSSWRGYGAAGVLAAACAAVAVVAIWRGGVKAPPASGPAPQGYAYATSKGLPVVVNPGYGSELQPVLTLRSFDLPVGAPGSVTLVSGSDQDDVLAWLARAQEPTVQHIPFKQVFRAQPMLITPGASAAQSSASTDGQAELAAFRFQR
jgi:hypothetical protein